MKALHKRRTRKDSEVAFGTSMNPGSKDTARWMKPRGPSAQRNMCTDPAGGYLCHPAPGIPLQHRKHRSSISPRPERRATSVRRQRLMRADPRGRRSGHWAGKQSGLGTKGLGKAVQPPASLPARLREAAKPGRGDAAVLRSLGSARVGSGAACESQLCTTRCPLPSPSNCLELLFLLLFLSPFFGFFLLLF